MMIILNLVLALIFYIAGRMWGFRLGYEIGRSDGYEVGYDAKKDEVAIHG